MRIGCEGVLHLQLHFNFTECWQSGILFVIYLLDLRQLLYYNLKHLLINKFFCKPLSAAFSIDAAIGYCKARSDAATIERGEGHTAAYWDLGWSGSVKAGFMSSPWQGSPSREASGEWHWMETCLFNVSPVTLCSPIALLALDQVCTSPGEDNHVQPCSTPKDWPLISFIPEWVWALICSSPMFNQAIYSRLTF